MRTAWLFVLAGCYAPTVPTSAVCTPGPSTACPSDQVCVTMPNGSFCLPADTVSPDATSIADAAPDADPGDAADAAIDAAIDASVPVTITRVQATRAMFDGSTTTISPTWPVPTTPGNLLVACMGLRWAGGISITPPPGWVQAIDASPSSGESRVRIWYLPSSAARSGPETWTFSNGITYQVAVGITEYAGPTALDRVSGATGTGTTLSTGTTPETTAAPELWFACTDATGAYPQSTPSAGFSTITSTVVGTTTNGLTTGQYERIVSAPGAAMTSTTIAASREWSAAVATFR